MDLRRFLEFLLVAVCVGTTQAHLASARDNDGDDQHRDASDH